MSAIDIHGRVQIVFEGHVAQPCHGRRFISVIVSPISVFFKCMVMVLSIVLMVGCTHRGDVLSVIELDAKVSEGRLQWYYRGSDEAYHYLAFVSRVPVPAPFASERCEFFRVPRPALHELLAQVMTGIDLGSTDSENWVKLMSRPAPNGRISLGDWHGE